MILIIKYKSVFNFFISMILGIFDCKVLITSSSESFLYKQLVKLGFKLQTHSNWHNFGILMTFRILSRISIWLLWYTTEQMSLGNCFDSTLLITTLETAICPSIDSPLASWYIFWAKHIVCSS